jgi:hypothetical protein
MVGKHEGDPDELRRAQALAQSDQLAVPKASWTDFFRHNGQWKNGKILLGTAGSWFCLDVAYYGLSLNTATVLAAIGYTTGPNVYEILRKTAIGNIIIVCAGAIPGYWMTVATVDTVGRKPIQLASFIILVSTALLISFSTLVSSALIPSLLRVTDICMRSQCYDIHCPRRMLPNPIPFNFSRSLRRVWQNWFHHWTSWLRKTGFQGCRKGLYRKSSEPLAEPRHANLRSLHAHWLLHDALHPRNYSPYT